MGFNCVRLPWSVELALQPRVVREPSLLAANPSLFGRTNLEILDVCRSFSPLSPLDPYLQPVQTVPGCMRM